MFGNASRFALRFLSNKPEKSVVENPTKETQLGRISAIASAVEEDIEFSRKEQFKIFSEELKAIYKNSSSAAEVASQARLIRAKVCVHLYLHYGHDQKYFNKAELLLQEVGSQGGDMAQNISPLKNILERERRASITGVSGHASFQYCSSSQEEPRSYSSIDNNML